MIWAGAEPFLECSSRGDRRFSAFYAKIRFFGDKSIEELYQAAKIFEDGSRGLTWKHAKGRKAVNQEWCNLYYSYLWDYYIYENPSLLIVLRQASGLSDLFGKQGHCCQAIELWRIRNKGIKGADDAGTR